MLRNLLLLVESTPSGQVAKKVACQIAAQGDCKLTALQIHETGWPVDEEHLKKSPRQLLAECTGRSDLIEVAGEGESTEERRDAELNIVYRDKALYGHKYTLLCQESESNDLTVLGREGNLAEERRQSAKEVINMMISYQPKPIIVAPPWVPSGHGILLICDGSPGSTRALQLFVAMGLADGKPVHVLSAHHRRKAAESHADAATRYLEDHGLDAVRHTSDTSLAPQVAIEEKVKETGAAMVVMGAYGRSEWRHGIFGSVTDSLIYYSPVPVFICR